MAVANILLYRKLAILLSGKERCFFVMGVYSSVHDQLKKALLTPPESKRSICG